MIYSTAEVVRDVTGDLVKRIKPQLLCNDFWNSNLNDLGYTQGEFRQLLSRAEIGDIVAFETLGKLVEKDTLRLYLADHPPPWRGEIEIFGSLGLLKSFYWLCIDKQSRESVSLTKHDLIQDIREMKQEKRSPAFIHSVVIWRSLAGAILPIFWDGVLRVFGRLTHVATAVEYVKRFFT